MNCFFKLINHSAGNVVMKKITLGNHGCLNTSKIYDVKKLFKFNIKENTMTIVYYK